MKEFKKMNESKSLEILKKMAELNLRNRDHHRVELIQRPLQIIFRNLQIALISNNFEDRFVIAGREIKKFLVGENANHSDPNNKDLFDRITSFIELFKKYAKEIHEFNYEELLHDKEQILSSYTRYLNGVMLNEE